MIDPQEKAKKIAIKYTDKLLEKTTKIYLDAIQELYETDDITDPEMHAAVASMATTLMVRTCKMFSDVSQGMSPEVQWELITTFRTQEPNLFQLIRKKYEPDFEIPTYDNKEE